MLFVKFGKLIEVVEIGSGSWEALAPCRTPANFDSRGEEKARTYLLQPSSALDGVS